MLDKSENVISYACKCLVCTSHVALCQLGVLAFKAHKAGNLFRYNEALEITGINRQTLAWGLATIVGAVIVAGIPAAMYLARNCKFSVFGYISAIMFLFQRGCKDITFSVTSYNFSQNLLQYFEDA